MHKIIGTMRIVGVFITAAAISLALRVEGLTLAVHNWDETTFLIMGKDLLAGNLPYTRLFDNKPPLAFVLYAFSNLAFPGQIAGLRIIGVLLVAITGSLVFWIVANVQGRWPGWMAGILTIATLSWVKSGQAVMTEHIAIVPLLASLAVITSCSRSNYRERSLSAFAWGLLTGMAMLVRSNLIIVALLVLLCMTLWSQIRWFGRSRQASLPISLMCLGIAFVLTLTVFPYVVTDNLALLWHGAIISPLQYAQTQGMTGVARSVIKWALSLVNGGYRDLTTLVLPLSSVFISALAVLTTLRGQMFNRHSLMVLTWTSIYFLGVCFSILRGGAFFEHYALQWMPFAAINLAVGLSLLVGQVQWKQRSMQWAAWSCFVIAFLLPLLESSNALFTRICAGDIDSPEVTVIKKLRLLGASSETKIWFARYHYAGWILDIPPITRSVVHPSNLGRSSVLHNLRRGAEPLTPPQELNAIAKEMPEFIVTSTKTPHYILSHPALAVAYYKLLQTQYKAAYSDPKILVLQRVRSAAN